MRLERARWRLPHSEQGVSCAQRKTAGRVAGRVWQVKGCGRRAYMQESQVRAHQARAQQQRGFRRSAPSESISQTASVGELGTREHGLLAAGSPGALSDGTACRVAQTATPSV